MATTTPLPEAPEQLLSYWRRHLAEAPAVLELPTDRPRPPVQRLERAAHSFVLPASLTAGLGALAQREGATLSMALLAGFSALLHRYSGQEDILVGTPSALRSRPGLEHPAGARDNPLVLRNDLSGDPRFADLLARAREVTLGAYAHQDLPFERLIEDLRPEHGFSHAPLFQVMFVPPDAEPRALSSASRCDLVLFMSRSGEELHGTFEYDTDLFDADRIARMAGHLQVLLEAAVAHPHQRLSSLPLLTSAEQHLMREWNSATSDYPRERCVHELFSEQAARTPEAVAVSYGQRSLTYRQLDERSNQLAHHLRSLGVGPEVLVGLCVERSPDLIVSILAILKAGGAYLPLDASHPKERLALMLEDARASVLLVHHDKLQHLPPFSGPLVCLDTEWDSISRLSTQPPAPSAGPENLAYVIYTSGSTGRPKGSAILHRGINALLFHVNFLQFTPQDRVAQASNASFDPSTFEIWGALLNGARLVGITANPARAPQEFAAQVRDEAVTVMFVTTAVLNLLAREAPSAFQFVHTLVFGGEAADPLALREILHHGPPRRLLNGYGPTECTVFSTFHHVSSPPALGASVPIGIPITNGPLYILDRHLQPVPIGVPGELYVSGERLGRCYFNRPELTARTYLPNPFSSTPGARLYKTGDLTRYLPDGRIEYLGRIDHQVKIRGYRVELGEIEEVLRQHPSIKECSVLAQEVGGDRRLAAYLVPHEGQSPTTAELRSYLRERVPEHMVPASFSLLPALPLTTNGKVDRRALLATEPARADEHDYQPPRTPMELALCRLWASLLQLERVGLHDNFFHLGGHSLLATQLVSRLRAEFRVEVPLRVVFSGPTVAQLAQHLSDERPTGLQRPLPPLTRAPRDRALPLSFSQERLWRFFKQAPKSSAYNMPNALWLRGRVEPRAIQGAFQAIIDRHESLRTLFSEEDGRPVQRVQPSVDFSLQEVDLRGREDREAEAQRLTVESAQQLFDLTRGPLLHASLLRLEDEKYLLLFCMHHIASDGWSMGVMYRELGILYAALVEGREPALAPLSIQYPDYAAWLRSWLVGAELEERLAYWKKALAGAPTVLNLPTDRPRPEVRTFSGDHCEFLLGLERSEALNAFCQREGVTPFMALLAIYGTVLARRAGQEEVVIASPIANRLQPELEPLIGMFINALLLRVNLRGSPSFRKLLQRALEETLDGYAHQEVPLDLVMNELEGERPPNRAPVFQAMFVLQNAPIEPLELPGLTVWTSEVGRGGTPYEFTLSMEESPEGFAGVLEFNSDLFDMATAQRLHAEMAQLLDAVMENPLLPVGLGSGG